MNSPYGFAELTGRMFNLLRAGFPRWLLALLFLAGAGVAVDLLPVRNASTAVLNLPLSIATVAAQYWLTRGALRGIGADFTAGAGYGALFLLGIVSGLGIALGLLLLVVPGLILLIRWWVAAPVLLDSSDGIFDALQRSWRQTEGHFWTLLGMLALLWLPALGVVLAAEFLAVRGGFEVPSSVVMNTALNAAMIAGWYSAVAAYSFSSGGDRLSEIFA